MLLSRRSAATVAATMALLTPMTMAPAPAPLRQRARAQLDQIKVEQ